VNRFLIASAPYEVISITEKKAVIKFLTPSGEQVETRLRARGVRVSGDAEVKQLRELEDETVTRLVIKGKGIVGFTFHRGTR
jgi:hypothetical protein